jgi:hypothetical protein
MLIQALFLVDQCFVNFLKNSTGEGTAALTDSLTGAGTQGAYKPLMAKKSRNQQVPVEKIPKPWPPITVFCKLLESFVPILDGLTTFSFPSFS